jgi:uncharacterized protein YndB with AHSA1/START domain
MTDAQRVTDIHRHFDAPRELVYRAFTDEGQVVEWFGPPGCMVVPDTVSIDAKVGGHRRLTMATYTGVMSWTVDETFTEVVENQRLVGYDDVTGLPDFDGVDRLTLSIEFFDEGDGTRVELREGPCSHDLEPAIREFWLQSFTKLDTFLADQSTKWSTTD